MGMNKNAKVEIGQSLPKEVWLEKAEELKRASAGVAGWFRSMNFDGMGEQDAEDWLMVAQMAYQAMLYVGEFASEKCRFIVIPDRGGKEMK